ncbi:hypothetical protein HPB47_024401 [Ixodes persulcatus]|uniref:Uncharacterized protein n=1 Tax=Ixodes persulcatus TaxID=34615 RepID=A0AC60Q4C8_IXOPE|nr:hypothetical protein HPB47_024401 [Ixodes persulcatus]
MPPDTTEYNTVGFPAPEVQIKVVHTKTGQVLGPRQNGELWVKSPTNMSGYHGNPEATLEVLTHDGWLRSVEVRAFLHHFGIKSVAEKPHSHIQSSDDTPYCQYELRNDLNGNPSRYRIPVGTRYSPTLLNTADRQPQRQGSLGVHQAYHVDSRLHHSARDRHRLRYEQSPLLEHQVETCNRSF